MMELKPCPFCGEDQLETCDDMNEGKEGQSFIACYDCNCYGPSATMPEDLWNTRPIEDELNQRIKELEAWQKEAVKKLVIMIKLAELRGTPVSQIKEIENLIKQAEGNGK